MKGSYWTQLNTTSTRYKYHNSNITFYNKIIDSLVFRLLNFDGGVRWVVMTFLPPFCVLGGKGQGKSVTKKKHNHLKELSHLLKTIIRENHILAFHFLNNLMKVCLTYSSYTSFLLCLLLDFLVELSKP